MKVEQRSESTKPCGNLLLGVCGSVGAFAVPHFIYLLRRRFAEEVHVITTSAAQAFVTPYVLSLFSGHSVFVDGTEMADGIRVPHIELTRRADLFLVMPATANLIAKAAHGIADDLLTTALLACEAPVFLAPNMNGAMWRHKAVQRNVRACRALGYHVIPPGEGYEVTDLEPTDGIMPALEEIVGAMEKVLNARRQARRPRKR